MISFVILTIGDNPEKLINCIKSIHRACKYEVDYEICIVGNNLPDLSGLNVNAVNDEEKKEFLGARKNIGTKNTTGDILVHCDDDIIFSANWAIQFKEYCLKNPDWEIMGNKVLLPDGSRYWDRATYLPSHMMVDYDFESEDVTFYQSGAFSISKRSLLNKICWDDDIPFYGMFRGFTYNEDVEFSMRLKEAGVKIHFDKHNTVWHNDFSYASNNITCNKKHNQNEPEMKCLNFLVESSV